MTLRVVCSLVAFVLIIVALLFGTYEAHRWYAIPYPIRAFQWNRAVFVNYVEQLMLDKIPLRKEDQGYSLGPDLPILGVAYVRRQGGSIVFSFQSLPPDSIQELIYSPDGDRGLRVLSDPSPQERLLQLQEIDNHWFYVVRDY